ncbi:MAG TPA: hypothetical protein PK476_01150 [Candidatus Pacearchaeota archaeon]|nr:hypothetical protein [Candidatus Pacearchaeota archaeon]HQM24503.1 hypothetical protein [Candidatus Pacearchaeota archaeon]
MNKNNIRILTTLVLVGLLFLPLTASAGRITDWLNQTLGDMASGMFDALTSVIFTLIANLVAGIPSAALDFLNWVAGPGFLKISMTGDDNPIVTEGWDITRNLANVALIFGLIIIAINIIIGNAEVQAKKALINFFLIAVLINFTPLICGIIIDASNALTNYFLQEGIKKDLVNFLAQAMADSGGFDFTALIVFFLFGIFSAVIYLLYALIFVCRYFILWILIILSPLAFASKVFPRSRIITKLFPSFCYWDEWWDMFIQWNVIGIPAGFFIYLSNMAMTEMAAGGFFASAEGISIFGKLFTYAMPFIFMAIGFMVTISSGGKVTGTIGGYGKKIWSKTGGAATAAATGAIGAGAGYAAGRASAAGGYIKEGTVGMASGFAYNRTVDKEEDKVDWMTRKGRDDAREKYKDFKQKTKEKAANMGIISREASLKRPEEDTKAEQLVKREEFDLNYFNRNQKYLKGPELKAADRKFAKQDINLYLNSAGTEEEYQRRLKAVSDNNDGSKEYKKIMTKALMNANFSKNKNRAGKNTDWSKVYGINLNQEMQKLPPKDLRDSVSEEFLEEENNLSKLSSNQLNYLRSNGSKAQVDAIEKVRERYKDNDPVDKNGNPIYEIDINGGRKLDPSGDPIRIRQQNSNFIRINQEIDKAQKALDNARQNKQAGVSGADEEIKKYEEELAKISALSNYFYP